MTQGGCSFKTPNYPNLQPGCSTVSLVQSPTPQAHHSNSNMPTTHCGTVPEQKGTIHNLASCSVQGSQWPRCVQRTATFAVTASRSLLQQELNCRRQLPCKYYVNNTRRTLSNFRDNALKKTQETAARPQPLAHLECAQFARLSIPRTTMLMQAMQPMSKPTEPTVQAYASLGCRPHTPKAVHLAHQKTGMTDMPGCGGAGRALSSCWCPAHDDTQELARASFLA